MPVRQPWVKMPRLRILAALGSPSAVRAAALTAFTWLIKSPGVLNCIAGRPMRNVPPVAATALWAPAKALASLRKCVL